MNRGDETRLVVGLRVRAVRAGSIGREEPEFDERTETPRWRREALAPAPATKIPAPHGSNPAIGGKLSGPEGQGAARLFDQPPIRSEFPPLTEGLLQGLYFP